MIRRLRELLLRLKLTRRGSSWPYNILTAHIAEQFTAGEAAYSLRRFTSIEDDAAEILGRHDGPLDLSGLTFLFDTAAENLSRHRHRVSLSGLTTLSDAAAASLGRHRGNLALDGLTGLSDAAAASLAKHQPPVWILLDELPETAVGIFRATRARSRCGSPAASLTAGSSPGL